MKNRHSFVEMGWHRVICKFLELNDYQRGNLCNDIKAFTMEISFIFYLKTSQHINLCSKKISITPKMKTKNSPSSSNRLSSTIGEQRNEPIIHNVTSVKYNKENEIVSHYLTCFLRLNKKA